VWAVERAARYYEETASNWWENTLYENVPYLKIPYGSISLIQYLPKVIPSKKCHMNKGPFHNGCVVMNFPVVVSVRMCEQSLLRLNGGLLISSALDGTECSQVVQM
jgi:hypothetical protein